MHKFLFHVVITIFVCNSIYGQLPASNNTIFWQISGKHIKTSYLFGTMHVMKSEDYLFPENFQSIIRSSDQVVLEISELPSQENMLKLIQLDSETFFDYFNPEQHDSIIEWAANIFSLNQSNTRMLLEHMRPISLAQIALNQAVGSSIKSYENDIINLAKANKSKLIGLETIDYQLNLLSQLDRHFQQELIMQYVRNRELLVNEFDDLTRTYKTQDLDSLSNVLNQQVNAAIFQTLLDNRNQTWLRELPQILSSRKSTFIAVGAGHLGGESGIISGLIKQGYTLTPLYIQTSN